MAPREPDSHRIFPHGKPEEFAPGLWQVRGTLKIPLVRKMVIHRLPSGGLLLHSVVAMDDEGLRALEALGRPEVMVIPHPMHTMDAPFYAKRYPDLKIIAPDDAVTRLGGRVKAHPSAEEELPQHDIRAHRVPGMKYTEIVLDVPSGGGRALLFTDLVGQGDVKGFAMRLLGPPRGAGIARIVRWRQIGDKAQVAGFLRKAGETPDLRAVMGAHSNPVTTDAAAFLHAAAAQL